MGEDYGVLRSLVGGPEEGVVVVDGAGSGVETEGGGAERSAKGEGAEAHGDADGIGGGLTSGVGCWSIWVYSHDGTCQ